MFKAGDKVVGINPNFRDGDEGKIFTVSEVLYNARHIYFDGGDWDEPDNICRAPDPGQEYSVGDWALPVVLTENAKPYWKTWFRENILLVPQRLSSVTNYCPGWGCNCLDGTGHQYTIGPPAHVVPIARTADGYDVNGTLLSVDTFKEWYGCDPIPAPDRVPVSDPKEPERRLAEPHDSEPPRETAWQPTYQDYQECCGDWKRRDGAFEHITPESLPVFYKSRNDFVFKQMTHGMKRIEPIPEQCIPGYQEPRRERNYGLTEEQRERWARVTEWD